jgi:predicted alpha/beta hydrolase family esterase
MNQVFLAGIGNSEPGHWQSIWYRSLGASAHWVEHADWNNPDADAWVADLERVVRGLRGPTVLVAHSLGCLLAVAWARRSRDPARQAAAGGAATLGDPEGAAVILGSFLVSLPDPQAPCFPRQAVGFPDATAAAPPGAAALLVASTTDPYGSLPYAQAAARAWKAELVDVGPLGHINLASHIGAWPQGRALFDRYVTRLISADR